MRYNRIDHTTDAFGLAPVYARVAAILRSIRNNLHVGAIAETEVRLVSDKDGYYSLASEDVSYDTRHWYACGVSWVSIADTDKDCLTTAIELVKQVADQLAEASHG